MNLRKNKRIGILFIKTGLLGLASVSITPFYFVHSFCLGLAGIGFLMSIDNYFKILKLKVNLLFLILLLFLYISIKEFILYGRHLQLPGSYLFWVGLPFIYSSVSDKNQFIHKIVPQIFSLIILLIWIIGIYTIIQFIFKGIQGSYIAGHSHSYIIREEFSRFTGVHPPYFAMYCGYSILILLNSMYWFPDISNFKIHKLFKLISIFCFGLWILLLESRIHILSLFLIIFIFKRKLRFITLITLIILFSTVLLNPQSRFREIVSGNDNSALLRLESWKCGIQIFEKNHLFGIGINQLQNELNNCYTGKSLLLKNMNTHNQFLHFAASGGIFGLLIFLILWGIIMVKLVQKHDLERLSLASFLLFSSLTENIFERHWGGILIGFFFLSLINLKKLHHEQS